MCALQVRGSKWNLQTNLSTAGAFYSKKNVQQNQQHVISFH